MEWNTLIKKILINIFFKFYKSFIIYELSYMKLHEKQERKSLKWIKLKNKKINER